MGYLTIWTKTQTIKTLWHALLNGVLAAAAGEAGNTPQGRDTLS
jgi:hypothetical protein